jgi:predicted RNA-binding protein with RPS1 domain
VFLKWEGFETMKLWIDDVRPAPEEYIWLRSVKHAKSLIESCEGMIAIDEKYREKYGIEIIDIDHSKQRISLSLKNTEPDPWIEAEEELKEGDIKEGVITRIKPFGAFVEVLPGVEALLPQSALSELQNAKNIIVKVGDKIDTKIIKFNPKDKRISLGLPTDEV